jgi:hypothetical protein
MKINKIISFLQNRFYFHLKSGFDINIKGVWYGFHWYWQSLPLFDIIDNHRKCNSIREYGVILFGLWLYIKIDD